MAQTGNGGPILSEDGLWYWDGRSWQSLVSADGMSRWNGQAWEPLKPAAPSDDRPAWLPAGVAMPTAFARDAAAPVNAPPPGEFLSAVPADTPAWQQRDRGPSMIPHVPPVFGLFGFIGLGLIALLVAKFVMPAAQDDVPVLVAAKARVQYAPNTVERYHVHQKLSGRLTLPNGSDEQTYSDVDATEAMRVVSVDAKGVATLGFKFEALSGNIDGNPIPFNAAKAREITLVISPDGRIVSGGTNGTAGGDPTSSDPGGDQFSSIMPSHDVRQGDSWGVEFDRPNPLGPGTMHYSTVNTFVRYDAIYGARAAVISTHAHLPVDMLLNIRQLMALTGDDGSMFPADAAIAYKGDATDDMIGYVDLESHHLVHAVDTSDFQFAMTFQGLPATAAFAPLKGTFHFGGHQDADMSRL